MVFVLNKNKKPLSPCHMARARKLLSRGKAVVHKKYPFTIRLKELKEAPLSKATYRLKVDYGSRYTGLSILSGNKVLWLAELHHKTDIKNKLDRRRGHRRFRRNKLRYRQPRFLNRKKNKGWIPPSLQSRVDNIASWTKKLQKSLPLTDISYENCKFDTQLMANPEISGVEYQQGTLTGYNVREYLLEKFNRTCIYCGAKNLPLEVEHLIPRSRGGSNRINNLGIACHDCNQKKGNQTPEEFGYPEIYSKINQSLRDSALINATRWKVFDVLKNTGLPVECGSGARTKMNRIRLGLAKTHYYDAACIGKSTPDHLHVTTNEVLLIKALGRGSYQRTRSDKYGFPKAYLPRQKQFFGFQSGDMIKATVPKGKYKGVWHGSVACRSTGSFNINLLKGRVQGIDHKYCQRTQRADGYKYVAEKKNREFLLIAKARGFLLVR